MTERSNHVWMDRVEDLEIRSLVKLVLAVVGLLLLLVLVSILPGVDRPIPGIPFTVAATISTIITLAIILLLLRIAAITKGFLYQLMGTEPEVAEPASAVGYWTIVFLAVVIAYEGVGSAVNPLMDVAGLHWVYDLAFFLLGIVSLALIGYHLCKLLDPLADFCVRALGPGSPSDPSTVQTTLPIGSNADREADQADRS